MEVAPASEASSFGKYTLVAKLATGGMAEIFLARLLSDGGFEKLVCIKRILPHLAKDPTFVAMFLDEARVVARISHPNVCQVFELGEIEGQYYIAMEYLAGVPLSIFRRTDFYPMPPDPQLVAGFGVQACEGLHHAHQLKAPSGETLGVVHRDISPQNLFVTLDGIVKVLDFGIAKVQDQSAKTSTGAVKGTYCYMSPEQLRGEKVDRRADVWALGAVLWESLAQRHLFKRETEFLTFQAITSERIPDICEVRPDVPPLVGDTIARAVSRDREVRFPTARAFGEALAQAVAPLGGAYTAATIADVVEASFADVLDEQRSLLELARSGDNFDLEHSNLLGQHVGGATPVSNIRGKLAEAKAEVEHYVRAQRAIRALETDEVSSSGFTPPPGWRAFGVQNEPASGVTIVPASIRRDPTPRPSKQRKPSEPPDIDRIVAELSVPEPVVIHKTSKLPWIVAILALAAAGTTAAMVMMNKQPPATTPPAPPQPIAAIAVDAAVAVTPADAALVQVVEVVALDASIPTPTVPVDDTPKKHTVRPITHTHDHDHDDHAPVVSGPPGYITIDSAPVYATIYIDGKKVGETPLVNITVPAGHHAVRAVSPSGTTRTLSITIESGKTAPVRRIEW